MGGGVHKCVRATEGEAHLWSESKEMWGSGKGFENRRWLHEFQR